MSCEIIDVESSHLSRLTMREKVQLFSTIPISYTVTGIYQVDGAVTFEDFREIPVEPYVKDYDASAEGGPERWSAQFDVRRWGFFLALDGGRPIGGAAVAFDTTGVHMLESRPDLA